MEFFKTPNVKGKSFLDIINSTYSAEAIAPRYNWDEVLSEYDKQVSNEIETELDLETKDEESEPEDISISYEFNSPYKKNFYSLFTNQTRPQLSDSVSTSNDMGYRNNNPGNLRPHAGWTGETKDNFKVFKTIEEGYEALIKDIEVKMGGDSKVMDNNTKIKDFFNIYAPYGDGDNDPVKYAKRVVSYTGLDPELKIKDMNEEQKQALIKGIVKVESPNSYVYLYEPEKRDSILSSVIKEKEPKFRGGGILYRLF